MTTLRKPRIIIQYFVPTVQDYYVPVCKSVYYQMHALLVASGNFIEKRIDVTARLKSYYIIPACHD